MCMLMPLVNPVSKGKHSKAMDRSGSLITFSPSFCFPAPGFFMGSQPILFSISQCSLERIKRNLRSMRNVAVPIFTPLRCNVGSTALESNVLVSHVCGCGVNGAGKAGLEAGSAARCECLGTSQSNSGSLCLSLPLK